jgi:hypothetical protein
MCPLFADGVGEGKTTEKSNLATFFSPHASVYLFLDDFAEPGHREK